MAETLAKHALQHGIGLSHDVRRSMCDAEGCPHEGDMADMKMCSRCQIQKYCGAECQLRDWPAHKTNCAVWSFLVDKKGSK